MITINKLYIAFRAETSCFVLSTTRFTNCPQHFDGGSVGPPFFVNGRIFYGNDHLTATPRQRGRKHSRDYPGLSEPWGNPEKTKSGKYTSSYECDLITLAAKFILAKASYKVMTSREQKRAKICCAIRSASPPIRERLPLKTQTGSAMSWLCARQRVATLSSSRPTRARSRSTRIFTTIPLPLDCTRKFRNFLDSSFALRRLSDRLCLENGLSIVENSEPRSKAKFRNYGEWMAGRKRPLPYQDRLRASIDTAFVKRPPTSRNFSP